MRQMAAAAAACSVMLVSCAGSQIPIAPRHPLVVKTSETVGDWQLLRGRNPFSGEVVCRLFARTGDAFYHAGAVAFRFRRGRNVNQAVYRLDGGEPNAWRDVLPAKQHRKAPRRTLRGQRM